MPDGRVDLRCADGRTVDVSDASLVLVGDSGRDQPSVEEHVEELAAHGAPAPEADTCWDVAALRPGWDDVQLCSEIEVDGAWRPYQSGHLAAVLEPEWYVERFRRPDGGAVVVFCGTVPARDGVVTHATAFRGRLADPASLRSICVEYAIDGH